MLDGLIHSYLDAFGQGWRPRDDFPDTDWDSLLPRSALSSPQTRTGEADETHSGNRRNSAGYRIVRVRYTASAG